MPAAQHVDNPDHDASPPQDDPDWADRATLELMAEFEEEEKFIARPDSLSKCPRRKPAQKEAKSRSTNYGDPFASVTTTNLSEDSDGPDSDLEDEHVQYAPHPSRGWKNADAAAAFFDTHGQRPASARPGQPLPKPPPPPMSQAPWAAQAPPPPPPMAPPPPWAMPPPWTMPPPWSMPPPPPHAAPAHAQHGRLRLQRADTRSMTKKKRLPVMYRYNNRQPPSDPPTSTCARLCEAVTVHTTTNSRHYRPDN